MPSAPWRVWLASAVPWAVSSSGRLWGTCSTTASGTVLSSRSQGRFISLFWYIFGGEPKARDGFVDLDETVPGLGLTINEDAVREFNIVE